MASYAVTWPTDTWGSRKRASVEAITMSASATKCRPPPAHMPLTAAITGLRTPLCQALMRSSARLVRRDCSRSAAGSRASWATSSPVWKAAPAPVLTMTRTSGSASSSAQAASSSASMVASMALPTSGRSKISHPTGAAPLDPQGRVGHGSSTSAPGHVVPGRVAPGVGLAGQAEHPLATMFLFTSVVPPSIVLARLRSIPRTS